MALGREKIRQTADRAKHFLSYEALTPMKEGFQVILVDSKGFQIYP
jgi:hypothetical protein